MKIHAHPAFLPACITLLIACIPLGAQPSYPPEIEDAAMEVYKSVDGVDLQLWIKNPPGHKPDKPVPAIVFFFGGGWRSGSPTQFVEQADWLAGRGMVAVLVDYRVSSRHGVPARDCVSDAKSAIRYVRKHAGRLGIDPDRIVAGGGSAGGHLAAAVATLADFDAPSDDLSFSAVPNALALFNPAVVLAPIEGSMELDAERITELEQRMGVDPQAVSPYHHVRRGLPPTIIFHGKNDTTVPFLTVSLFQEKMAANGNRCELTAYEGAGHGFFNFGRENNIHFIDSMNRLDAFLVSLKYLVPGPEVEVVK